MKTWRENLLLKRSGPWCTRNDKRSFLSFCYNLLLHCVVHKAVITQLWNVYWIVPQCILEHHKSRVCFSWYNSSYWYTKTQHSRIRRPLPSVASTLPNKITSLLQKTFTKLGGSFQAYNNRYKNEKNFLRLFITLDFSSNCK